jgi:predicted nucleotidyltransferase
MRYHAQGPQIDITPRLGDLVAELTGLDGLVAAWIYGSYGTPYQTPLSDLDLAVLYRPDRLPALRDEWQLQQRIAELLKEDDVSVLVLNRAQVILQFKVLAEGRRLLCRDSEVLADFTERILSEHSDFMIDHRRFTAEYDRALAGGAP